MTANTAKSAPSSTGTRRQPHASRPGGSRRLRHVSLRNLSRFFGSTRALDGLNLEIEPGELVALLGPSGCGKTTALRILAGFESADTGAVLVDGQDLSPIPPARRDMGMVFQSYSLFPNMTALDNVAFGLRMRKKGAAPAAHARPTSCWTWSAWPSRPGSTRTSCPAASSSGSRWPGRSPSSRASCCSTSRCPRWTPRCGVQLREQIRSLQQRLHTTTLFVTHDQEEALSMADRVGVMRSGRLEQIAAPSELYADPATAFVAEFVGTMNRIPGELEADGRVRVLGAVLPSRATARTGPGRTSWSGRRTCAWRRAAAAS